MDAIYIDMLIIVLEIAAIVALIIFVKKLSKEKKERIRLEEENAIKEREKSLNEKLANQHRR